jgi:lauroyl/myristoyl acyltransferase
VPAKQLDEVLQQALGAGAGVVSVTPHRASLETIFLSAVQAAGGARKEAGS